MLYIIVGILLFGLLIAVHEWGHFITAKLLGVKVNEFAIGMGPALVSFQKGETQYSLRLLPVGGYCAMEGEDETNDDPRAFSNKAPWRRFIILAAGSFMNFVAGFLLVALLFTVAGSYAVPRAFPALGQTACKWGTGSFLSMVIKFPSIRTCLLSWLPPAGRRWTWWSSGTGNPLC